ncbi:MAG: 2-oxoacid:acceptor oxidoreductase family protein [Candidatus Lokiarchaeota archaeon]|nr:2-oxoacid:acceptor oxidoreductase family protein [Candidatus Lokiarchaeota archaeon]
MNEISPENDLITLIILGRGGQGAVTACEIIAEAAYMSGNFIDVHAYPSFGAERRGAPVQAYAKLSRKHKIWDRAQIQHPNILIVFDETVLDYEIISSLHKNGIFIINSDKEPEFFSKKYNFSDETKIVVADISKLALDKDLTIDGNPIINTPILGLLSKAFPDLNLTNLKKVVLNRLGEKLGVLNYELIEEGYHLAKIL